jgi:hypothetical protein
MESSDSYVKLLTSLNPTICNFFSYFSDDDTTIYNWFKEFSKTVHQNSTKIASAKSPKLLLLKGALKLVKSKGAATEFLPKTHETLYEDVLFEPFGEEFFDPDSIYNKDSLLRFRKTMLNAPRRLLFDLVFIDKLSISQTCTLLSISEQMLEPFIYSIFQHLVGNVQFKSDRFDELELFSTILHQKNLTDLTPAETPLHFRLNRLVNYFSIDTRKQLEGAQLTPIIQTIFPEYSTQSKDNSESESLSQSSVIDQIRKRNQEMNLQEAASMASAIEDDFAVTRSPANKANENVLKAVKPALGILALFACIVVYRVVRPAQSNQAGITRTSVKTVPFTQANQGRNEAGTMACGTADDATIYAYETLRSKNEECLLTLKDNINITVYPETRLSVSDSGSIIMKFGSVRATFTLKNKELKITSKDGYILSQGNTIYFSKTEPDYSVAGVEAGLLKATSNGSTKEIGAGKEIRLGSKNSLKPIKFNSDSYFAYKQKTKRVLNRRRSSFFGMSINDANDEQLDSLVIRKEKLLKKIKKKPKDFLQKL